MNKIAIVGASSRIAHMTARIWVENKECNEIVLIGRNSEKLNRVRDDLVSRDPNLKSSVYTVDFCSSQDIQNCVDNVCTNESTDIVLVAQGTSLPDNETLRNDFSQLESSVRTNYLSVILFTEAFAQKMEQKGEGKIAVIGSVAGDRGRNSNYIYGASKSAVETYLQGLRHHFALKKKKISVSLIKPGPTISPLTVDMPQNKLSRAEDVAACIVKGISKGKSVIYAPIKWKLIMTVIKMLPDFIFNKMKI